MANMATMQSGVSHFAPDKDIQACVKCHLPVAGECLMLDGECFHRECLVCSECACMISGPCRTAMDGSRICDSCHTAKLPVCPACSCPVQSEKADPSGRCFHRECWVCADCKEPITGRHFVQGSGVLPTCLKCDEKRKPKCALCTQAIIGECLPVDGRTYHRDCFRCYDCNEPITGKFCKRDGNYLCEPCEIAHAPMCSGCAQPIFEEHTSFGGLPFHKACFCCATCTKPIAGCHGRRRLDSMVVCLQCKEEEAPKCAGCRRPVLGHHLDIGDKVFHSECFKCSDCAQPLSDSHFKRGNDFLCKCCEDARAPQCGCCSKPIWEKHPLVEGVPFHNECFRCTTCGCQLCGSYFPSQDGQPTCKSCHDVERSHLTAAHGETTKTNFFATLKPNRHPNQGVLQPSPQLPTEGVSIIMESIRQIRHDGQ